ncbi:hypothetical protein [Aquisphaera insulae]|uniref:hypothetical protein n=1 Tax=Aquisphaera insulae TaxID=2712864 RepID=UPI0013EE0E99|nr:hypothetical protein [Aquisphaera insulae]
MTFTTIRSARRGMAAVAVLVCLVVLTMISGALLRLGVVRRDGLLVHEREAQSQWLAQAGLERGLARLASNASYAGETWTLSRADLGLGGTAREGRADDPAAVIVIKVEQDGASRHLVIHADYPPEAPRRARSSLQVELEPGSVKTGASR